MDREYTKRYSTAEFANFFNISKHTLFYYDKIGLFSPAGRDKNGYRYYISSQIGVFDTILTLRNTGLPIEKIMDYIEADDSDIILSMFRTEKKQLDIRIAELEHIRTSISIQADLLMDFRNRKEGEIDIKHFDEERIKEVENKEEIDDEESWSMLFSSMLDDHTKSDSLNQGATISLENILNGKSEIIKSFFLKRADGENIIPAGLYFVLYTKRPYNEFNEIYSSLFDRIEADGYIAVSDSYEEYALPDNLEKTNWISATRIRIRVEKRTRDENP